jgi:hypothetical protein
MKTCKQKAGAMPAFFVMKQGVTPLDMAHRQGFADGRAHCCKAT